MKKVLLFLLSMGMLFSMHAQDLKISINPKGKMGFVNKEGIEVIKHDFDNAKPFKDGIAIVTKSNKMGFIDTNGKVLLPLTYTNITPWTDTLFLIEDGKNVGIADHSGKIVVEPKYSMISPLNHNGKAVIGAGGKKATHDGKQYIEGAKYGIIDNNGKIIIAPTYKGLYEFSYAGENEESYHEGKRLAFNYHYLKDTLITDCKYLGISNNGDAIYKSGIITIDGDLLMPMGNYDLIMEPKSDMVRYYSINKKTITCGYYNISRKTSFIATEIEGKLDDTKFWTHGDFVGEIAPVNGKTWSFVDKAGRTVRAGYSEIIKNDYFNVVAAKNMSGIWDVFDTKNNNIDKLCGFSNIAITAGKGDKELYSVCKDGKFGIIDRNGTEITPFIYDEATGNANGLIAIKQGDKWGAINEEGRIIIPVFYDGINAPAVRNETDIWVNENNLFYHFNTEKGTTSGEGYALAFSFDEHGLAKVVPANQKLDDSMLNKALSYAPNAKKEEIINADLNEMATHFGFFINKNDERMNEGVFPHYYNSIIINEIKKVGFRPLTKNESKEVLLTISSENRFYKLSDIIPEDQWNY